MIWLLLACWATEAHAAPDPTDPSADVGLGIEDVPPGPRPDPADVQQIAYEIGLKLRCPVCQGLSVAASTSAAAVQMQDRIRVLVAMGYTEAEIRAYFVERYGEWILLDPPAQGMNLLIYVGPGVLFGLALAWAAKTVFTWRREEDDVPLPSDVGLAAKDKYEQRLLAELEE